MWLVEDHKLSRIRPHQKPFLGNFFVSTTSKQLNRATVSLRSRRPRFQTTCRLSLPKSNFKTSKYKRKTAACVWTCSIGNRPQSGCVVEWILAWRCTDVRYTCPMGVPELFFSLPTREVMQAIWAVRYIQGEKRSTYSPGRFCSFMRLAWANKAWELENWWKNEYYVFKSSLNINQLKKYFSFY